VEIYSYNDHRSAPFSRAWWLALAPPTLPGRGSRHCHGINCAHWPVVSAKAILRQQPQSASRKKRSARGRNYFRRLPA